jgi:hypothetical protein
VGRRVRHSTSEYRKNGYRKNGYRKNEYRKKAHVSGKQANALRMLAA